MGEKQSEGKAVSWFLPVLFLVMCILSIPPDQNIFLVLWNVFFGLLVLFSLGIAFVGILNKIG